ncbi:alpha/beta hydrolase [Mycolicibacterium sp. CH28]|uniref:alpha/beta fold hydrolase n=1 Tax=Mycolicibacterium sp. CH28 TaxID=2512237 RepID=UPI00108162B1|nr:alpha/beta hydrolase [Mycolicibacterium sp. CH28]TGD83935.1 alpha/beta hydrolase [Mycolicibacterium sp. CH28]
MIAPTERLVDVNGVRLRVVEAGDRGAPVVILTHGFPELAYSWRHQIPVLADAGYHVLAPDQRGYGGSSRPDAIDAYDITALTGDVVGLLDEVGAERAAVVGHDFGAVVAWNMPLLYPERVAAVAGLSVPPVPRPLTPPTEAFRRIFGDSFFYILYFQQPGVADAELGADPRRTMSLLLGGMRTPTDETAAQRMLAPGPAGFLDRLAETERLPDWLSPDELDNYVDVFGSTGFTGALNWYRNFDRNWHIMSDPPSETISAPALFVGGTADPTLGFTRVDRAGEVVKGPYRQVLLDGAGHWIQQERPDDVNRELCGFLSRLEW